MCMDAVAWVLGKWDALPREWEMLGEFVVQRCVFVGLEYDSFRFPVGYSLVLVGFQFGSSRVPVASQ